MLVIKRKIKGPCWLEIKGCTRVTSAKPVRPLRPFGWSSTPADLCPRSDLVVQARGANGRPEKRLALCRDRPDGAKRDAAVDRHVALGADDCQPRAEHAGDLGRYCERVGEL